MNKKLLALTIVSLFALALVFSAAPNAKAATGEWITSYTITDLATGQIIMQGNNGIVSGSNLLQGESIKVAMTISVPITVPDSTLTLTTGLSKATGVDTFWERTTTDYPVQNYNPNTQTVTFSQSKGDLVISCTGTIPTGLTTSSAGATTLHIPAPFTVISLTGPNSQNLDQIKPMIIDDAIANYNQLHSTSVNALNNLIAENAAPAYVALYENVINGSEQAAQAGFIDNAVNQLSQLAVSEQPPVEGTSSFADNFFIPIAGALAAIAVIGIILFMRARGKSTYVFQVVEDQIRDLEGLTLRAAKVDKSLSAGLETIEERLKRAVGA